MSVGIFSGGNFINSLQAAGKNAVINGGFDIWQRGTSVAGTGSVIYTADRWTAYNANITVSRQTTSDTTNLPFIQYCARVQRTAGNTSTSTLYLINPFETINTTPYVGKTITFSFYARAGANFSATSNALIPRVTYGTGTDQNPLVSYTNGTNVINSSATLTTTWQRFTYTGTIATNATEMWVGFQYDPVGTAGANDYFEITGVQLELGSTATTFSRAGGTIQGELAACQRYYYRQTSTNAQGFAIATTIVDTIYTLPTMRVSPSAIDSSGLAVYSSAGGGSPSYNTGTITQASAGANFSKVRYTHGSAVFTAGTAWELLGTYVGFSAEL